MRLRTLVAPTQRQTVALHTLPRETAQETGVRLSQEPWAGGAESSRMKGLGLLSLELREQELVIKVPRLLPARGDLKKCRARAKVAAARQGVRTEPEVVPYITRAAANGRLVRDSQGWIFTFSLKDEESVEPKDQRATGR